MMTPCLYSCGRKKKRKKGQYISNIYRFFFFLTESLQNSFGIQDNLFKKEKWMFEFQILTIEMQNRVHSLKVFFFHFFSES